MGATYSVSMKVKVTDEKGAIEALKEKIRADVLTDYGLEKFSKRGVTTESFDDLIRIFLAGRNDIDITDCGNDVKEYTNDFDASYGWERVLMEMFSVLAPFLEDNSRLLIYPDSDYDELIVKDGKSVQIH